MGGVVLGGGVGVGGGVGGAGVAADDIVLGDGPVVAPREVGELRPVAGIAVDAGAALALLVEETGRLSLLIDTRAVLEDQVGVPVASQVGHLDVGAEEGRLALAGLTLEIPAVFGGGAVHRGNGHDARSVKDVLGALRRVEHLEALAPFVPVVRVRCPEVHFAYACPVRIEDIRLLRAVAPEGLLALVGDLLVDTDGQVAPYDDRAGRSVLHDADAGEVGMLVAHRLRAAPAGDLGALDELVAHPVALLGHEAGSVGYSVPENDFPGLLLSEADD